MTQHFGIVDNDGDAVEVDQYRKGIKIIDTAHAEIHEGNAYVFGEGFQLAEAGEKDYLITVGAGTSPHLVIKVTFALAGIIRFYEGSDRTGSNEDTPYNRNRNSTNTSGVTIHGTVSGGSTDGTLIWGADYGSAGGFFTSGDGGRSRADSEWILKPSTKYMLNLTSQAAANNVAVAFDWYE